MSELVHKKGTAGTCAYDCSVHVYQVQDGAAARINIQFCIQRPWCSSQSDYVTVNGVRYGEYSCKRANS